MHFFVLTHGLTTNPNILEYCSLYNEVNPILFQESLSYFQDMDHSSYEGVRPLLEREIPTFTIWEEIHNVITYGGNLIYSLAQPELLTFAKRRTY